VIPISPQELRLFSQLIYGISGVCLDDSKAYLLENRLGVMLRDLQCSTFTELHTRIRRDGTRKLERRLLDLVTTGETSFFRDQTPFDLLQQKILPDLIDRKSRLHGRSRTIPLRIWSAACSTGQEIYSIAMILRELLGTASPFEIRLLGTDISDQAVATASRGIYNRIEIERGLPTNKLSRHFLLQDESTWKVHDDLRAMASFRTFNLQSDLTGLGRFDIILCRNVAIYFSEKDRQDLFNRLEHALEPEGALLIGATESLGSSCPQFIPHRHMRSVYYKVHKGAR
jgi:chemotaxis protein methyltransferase CheR